MSSDDQTQEQEHSFDDSVSGASAEVVQPSTAPNPAPASAPAPAHSDSVVDAWVAEHIHGSPIAQETNAWNHFMSVIERLKEKLRGE